MTKRLLSAVLCVVVIACILAGCGNTPAVPTDGIIVTDCVGRKVTVPKQPHSICAVCPFSVQIAVLLGAGEQITSAAITAEDGGLLYEICPSLRNASVIRDDRSINTEEIARADTDLILVNKSTWDNADEKAKLEAVGVPYVVIGYDSIDEQLDAVTILGKTLGKEKEAEEYVSYFRDTIQTLAAPKSTEAPRLYHAVGDALYTDAADSYCAEWIAYTGAVSVSTDGKKLRSEDGKAFATVEQIHTWDPDFIICSEADADKHILSEAAWADLRAVKEKKVYRIPVGLTHWGQPDSVETPLAILWLAKLAYPELYGNMDIRLLTADFYQRFYDYTPDDAMLDAILQADTYKPASE